MARLQTGGARVSVMPDPGLVDPRLLAPNFAGIGQGIGQGLSLVGQGLELQEQRAMAPKRQALADLQIAAAQEDMAGAPTIRSLRQLQLQEAERQAALAGITPVEIGTEGAFVEGGDFISPTGKYTDQVVGEVKQFYNPQTGAIETRRIPTRITPGGEIAAAAQGALAESALLKDRASLVRAQIAKTVTETNAMLNGRGVKVSRWERINPSIEGIGGQVKLVALGDNGEILKEVLVSPADADLLDAKDKGIKSKWWNPSTWGSDDEPAAGGLTGDAEVDAFISGGEPVVVDESDVVDISPEASAILAPAVDPLMGRMRATYQRNLNTFGPDHPATINQALMIENYVNGRPIGEGTIPSGGSLLDRILGREPEVDMRVIERPVRVIEGPVQ